MLVEMLCWHARRHPGRLAVADPTRRLSYRRLAGVAAAVRRVVEQSSDCPRVGLMLPSSAAFAGSFLGVLWAGRTAVPLNPALASQELCEVVGDAQIDCVLTISALEGMARVLPVRKLVVLERAGLRWRGLWHCLRRPPGRASVGGGDVAVMLYTSGTTGRPRGVCLSYENLLSDSRACIARARIRPEHRFLGLLPSCHAFGLTGTVIVPLVLGAGVFYLPRFQPAEAIRRIGQERISVLMAVPSMYRALLGLKGAGREALESVVYAISGGEPLAASVADRFRERFGVGLLEGYGLTEASPVVTLNVPWAQRPGSVGQALPGVRLRVVDG
ncbi:MAG: class I adenylate-forming enzyme family protein, partial [Phycisphaerae bacterium]